MRSRGRVLAWPTLTDGIRWQRLEVQRSDQMRVFGIQLHDQSVWSVEFVHLGPKKQTKQKQKTISSSLWSKFQLWAGHTYRLLMFDDHLLEGLLRGPHHALQPVDFAFVLHFRFCMRKQKENRCTKRHESERENERDILKKNIRVVHCQHSIWILDGNQFLPLLDSHRFVFFLDQISRRCQTDGILVSSSYRAWSVRRGASGGPAPSATRGSGSPAAWAACWALGRRWRRRGRSCAAAARRRDDPGRSRSETKVPISGPTPKIEMAIARPITAARLNASPTQIERQIERDATSGGRTGGQTPKKNM